MSDEVLVKVEGVSKKFCRSLKRSLWYGVQDIVSELNPLGRPRNGHSNLPSSTRFTDNSPSAIGNSPVNGLRPDEFWAVNDVSFQLRRGECLGLIGPNGSGKTTLLKMLNGLIKPEHGRIEMRGRVGALISLGAGFNPILTGRENIYVNGSVLGLTKKEIDAKIEEIIDFADIREFIDSPVQSYSSGMHVRLGFAVATALEPDILLVDEVLAVGDIGFRAKCFDRLERLRSKVAIMLVSHNRQDIARMCERVIVLTQGRFAIDGGVADSFARYDQCFQDVESCIHKNRDIGFVAAHLHPSSIKWGDNLTLRLAIDAHRPMSGVTFRASFMDHAENCLSEWRSENHIPPLTLHEGRNDLTFRLGSVRLQSGLYFCNMILSKPGEAQFLLLAARQATLQVEGSMSGLCAYQI